MPPVLKTDSAESPVLPGTELLFVLFYLSTAPFIHCIIILTDLYLCTLSFYGLYYACMYAMHLCVITIF